MLRIDETSKTLVAPQAGGFVTEVAPEGSELLALVSSGWDAFAAELGHPSLRLVAREPVPGLDLLAFDEQSGRTVIVQLAGAGAEAEVGRALVAASEVAGWDAAGLAAVHDALEAAVPGDSPRLVFLGAGFDPRFVGALEWLTRRHGLEASCFSLSVIRFGAERLLAVRRDWPPREGQAPDPGAEVTKLLGDPLQAVGVATTPGSTPPPGR